MEDNYVMVLEHVNQSEDFALGFEAGRIWELMKSGEVFKDFIINEANFDQVLRMAAAMGYEHPDKFQNTGNGYIYFWATPVDITPLTDKG